MTKLGVNKKPGLSPVERSRIRAEVHALERSIASNDDVNGVMKKLLSVKGKVMMLGRFHPSDAEGLKTRLDAISKAMLESKIQT